MYFTYQEKRIFYESHGTGPCIVLLHGFLESSYMWKEFLPEWTKRNRVLVLDFPGHGKSEVLAEIQGMELLAAVVNELLKYLGISEVSFLGHSMGGYVALAFLEAYPEKVSKIVLLNSTTESDSEERKENRNRAVEIIQRDKEVFVSMGISNLFSEDSRSKFSSEINHLKETAKQFPSEGIIALAKGMRDRKDRTQVLARFSGIKLFVCGAQDPIVPLKVSETVSKRTSSELIILQGSHMSWLENPIEIVKILHFNDIF